MKKAIEVLLDRTEYSLPPYKGVRIQKWIWHFRWQSPFCLRDWHRGKKCKALLQWIWYSQLEEEGNFTCLEVRLLGFKLLKFTKEGI